ncbi:cell division protein FtsB [Alkalimonas sp.]|uniref:cell division protein FtsB n=1 Tax=Alkalimonas sp. TaxID=1872453 RepID=UPI00263BC9C3|nr:cell division protein FtsB [Alkalimonas sp.]MCC5826696.1 cell division protein FtsB [Alkalimonas sp.]
MRLLTIALLILLLLLQYRLWFGQHSVSDYLQLTQQLEQQALANEELAKRNRLLLADVDDLRLGLEAIEERARNELGMIRDDEVFFRIVTDSPSLNDQRQGITLPLQPERR